MHNSQPKIKEVALTLWMPRELRDNLQTMAKARTISLSALIRLALSQYIKANR